MNCGKAFFVIEATILAVTCGLCGGGCSSSHGGGNTAYGYNGTEEGTAATTSTTQTEQPNPSQASTPQASAEQTTATQTNSDTSQVVIPLYKEEAIVGKREVPTETIHLRKVVHIETVNQPVQIRRETISIEREPAGGTASTTFQNNQTGQTTQNTQTTQTTQTAQASTANQPFEEQDIVIQLHKEEPVVEKRVVQTEEVIAQKRSEPQTETVQRQVRQEDITVDKGTAQNVQVSPAVGTASSPGAQSSGTAASADTSSPLTDISTIESAVPSSIYGRPVKLSGVTVQEVVNPQLISIAGPGIQKPLYTRLAQPIDGLKAGDKINLTGVVQNPTKVSDLANGLTSNASQALKAQPLLIESKSAGVSQ